MTHLLLYQDAPNSKLLTQLELNSRVVISGLVLVVTWFCVRLLTGFFAQLGARFRDKRLLLNQIATVARFFAWSAGIAIAVRAMNLSKEVVLTLGGAAAVTIGFAVKDLAASVLAGLTIIIDRPFQVGDRVRFGDHYGEISSIGLRSVRLVTLDDNLITIPNNKFLTDIVSSGNAGALDMQIQLDFFIGIDQDIATAKRVVQEAMLSNRYVYTKKPWNILVHQVIQGNYVALRIRSKAYVLDVQYEKAYESELNERILQAFREHHILPPAVLFRQLPAGKSPPVYPRPDDMYAAMQNTGDRGKA